MGEIKVNAEQWDEISDEEKSQIDTILREVGLIQPEDQIVGDADTPTFDLELGQVDTIAGPTQSVSISLSELMAKAKELDWEEQAAI